MRNTAEKNISKMNDFLLNGDLIEEISNEAAEKYTGGSNSYVVETKWGSSPWYPGGIWTLGGRANQPLVELNISSSDGGQTFTGTMRYEGEGAIDFRATRQ